MKNMKFIRQAACAAFALCAAAQVSATTIDDIGGTGTHTMAVPTVLIPIKEDKVQVNLANTASLVVALGESVKEVVLIPGGSTTSIAALYAAGSVDVYIANATDNPTIDALIFGTTSAKANFWTQNAPANITAAYVEANKKRRSVQVYELDINSGTKALGGNTYGRHSAYGL